MQVQDDAAHCSRLDLVVCNSVGKFKANGSAREVMRGGVCDKCIYVKGPVLDTLDYRKMMREVMRLDFLHPCTAPLWNGHNDIAGVEGLRRGHVTFSKADVNVFLGICEHDYFARLSF